MTEHARFHKTAANIAEQANGGRQLNSDEVLGSGSEFATTSLSVVKAIKNLQNKLG